MALEYRPWRDGDDLALNELWGDPETAQSGQFRAALAPSSPGRAGSEPASGPGTAGPGSAGSKASGSNKPGPNTAWRRCIVAQDQGVPVAAAVVYETTLHPERLWAYVEVAKDQRRAGVGATLMTMLRREAEQAAAEGIIAVRQLRTKVEPDTAGAAFAAAMGLQVRQRSRFVVIRPGTLRLPVFGDGSEGAATAAVQDLATGSVELTDVVGRYYSSIHAWDPTGAMSVGTVQRLFLDDLSGAHGAIVLREEPASAFGAGVQPTRKGRIRAFAVSYAEPAGEQNAAPTDVFLGHEPSLPEQDAAEAVRDLLALLAHQYPVVLEVDDSMAAIRAVVEPLLSAGKAAVQGAETLIVSD